MKINQIINETTTAGVVATVAKPLGVPQKRPEVKGLKPVQQLGGKKKGPYANSISEGKKVDEAKLDEEDIILVPGRTSKRKTGFVPRGQSRVDHEVEMARSDVLATMKNAKAIYELLKNRSEEEGLEGWVQEKLIKANDYLNAVKEYYDEKVTEEMTGAGVIAGGPQYEGQEERWRVTVGNKSGTLSHTKVFTGTKEQAIKQAVKRFATTRNPVVHAELAGKDVAEGAKVDRMVKHVAQSEKKLGHTKKEAENIAWATANKRGMLDNKNKKKAK